MAQKIITKNGTGTIANSDIVKGELAINTDTGVLYYGNTAGNAAIANSNNSVTTSETTITATQADRITANHAKVGISTSQASAITANTNKIGFVTTMPTATSGHTVSMSVLNTKGQYTLAFTMVDSTGKTPVTKTASIPLK